MQYFLRSHNARDSHWSFARPRRAVGGELGSGTDKLCRHHHRASGYSICRVSSHGALVATSVWLLLISLAPQPTSGFSLPTWSDPPGHRLLRDDRGCSGSCDADRDYECDRPAPGTTDDFEAANGASSCDTHPTASCDQECAASPNPPPRHPWPGKGTWPAPPPSPPPSDDAAMGGWIVAIVALVVLTCIFSCLLCLCCMRNDDIRLYYCPCLDPCWTGDRF